jgi:hypothetical protein
MPGDAVAGQRLEAKIMQIVVFETFQALLL